MEANKTVFKSPEVLVLFIKENANTNIQKIEAINELYELVKQHKFPLKELKHLIRKVKNDNADSLNNHLLIIWEKLPACSNNISCKCVL